MTDMCYFLHCEYQSTNEIIRNKSHRASRVARVAVATLGKTNIACTPGQGGNRFVSCKKKPPFVNVFCKRTKTKWIVFLVFQLSSVIMKVYNTID